MFGSLARKLFGNANDRLVKTYRDRVARINALEPQYQALSDEALAANQRLGSAGMPELVNRLPPHFCRRMGVLRGFRHVFEERSKNLLRAHLSPESQVYQLSRRTYWAVKAVLG